MSKVAQARVQPKGRACRAPTYVIGGNLRNSQEQVSSMKRESGLCVEPSVCVSIVKLDH
jgi:hypothetical protein